jgi:hypothetical protein
MRPRTLLLRHGLSDPDDDVLGDVGFLVQVQDPGVVGDRGDRERVVQRPRLVRGAVARLEPVRHDDRVDGLVDGEARHRHVAHDLDPVAEQRTALHGLEHRPRGTDHGRRLVAAGDDPEHHRVTHQIEPVGMPRLVGHRGVASIGQPPGHVGERPREGQGPRDRPRLHQQVERAVWRVSAERPDDRLHVSDREEQPDEHRGDGRPEDEVAQRAGRVRVDPRRPDPPARWADRVAEWTRGRSGLGRSHRCRPFGGSQARHRRSRCPP